MIVTISGEASAKGKECIVLLKNISNEFLYTISLCALVIVVV